MGVDAPAKTTGWYRHIFLRSHVQSAEFPGFRHRSRVVLFLLRFRQNSEMASGCRTFDDNEIRDAVIVIVPKLQKNLGSPGRGNDRGELDGASRCVFWQISRETGPGDDEIGSVFDTAADVFLVVGQGAHDIDADDAAV